MIHSPKVLSCLAVLWLITVCTYSTPRAFAQTAPGRNPALKAFLGRWDLTLKAPDREYPSWLEITQQDGQPKAEMVGRWGNARPLPQVEVSHGVLTFTSPKGEEDSSHDLVFTGQLISGQLSGTLIGPDNQTWHWTGRRAPSLKRTGVPHWGARISLFDGKDLTGWHPSDPKSPAKWTVEDGTLVSPGHGPELINDRKFEDFKLHVEFNCGEQSNSGVYLRGRYELQIETESEQEPPSHHTGGVYGFIAPTPELPRKAGVWQTFDITLLGRTVTVVQNGQTIIDHKDIPGITGGALDSDEQRPGPIYLQGSEKGHVAFRNIVITPATY
jgi:Domain of Unknown Function (DUF1080)